MHFYKYSKVLLQIQSKLPGQAIPDDFDQYFHNHNKLHSFCHNLQEDPG